MKPNTKCGLASLIWFELLLLYQIIGFLPREAMSLGHVQIDFVHDISISKTAL